MATHLLLIVLAMMRVTTFAALRCVHSTIVVASLWIGFAFAWLPLCFGQAPPNDNFVDRIMLQGNSVAFTGTASGATYEQGEGVERGPLPCWQGASVWWSWTASESVAVILQGLEYYQDYPHRDVLRVWAPTNLITFPSYSPLWTSLVSMSLDPAFPGEWIAFFATEGMEYQIRLAGCEGRYKLRLVATNNPVIFEQPKSLTVTPNAGAFFSVMAAGIQPLNYQWQFNGIPLATETNAMLALNNVSWDDAGLYSVVVSNSTGSSISQSALLQVRDTIVAPFLSVSQITRNSFDFIFSGETARSYRIEYSTNLINWLPATNFPLSPLFETSVIFNETNNLPLSLPHSSGSKFVRALTYSPSNHVCDNNLKAIRIAKELWANAVDRGYSDTPRGSDILPYLKNNQLPSCPVGGSNSYVMTGLGFLPTCKIPEHVLEEPR